MGNLPITARQLREFVLPDEAHPAGDPGSRVGKSPGGRDGYGAVFAIKVRVAMARSRYKEIVIRLLGC